MAIFVFLAVVLALSGVMVLLARFLGAKRYDQAKETTYECGIEPRTHTSASEQRVPVKYATVALLFIIFDVETAFFLPVAVIFRSQLATAPLYTLAFAGLFALLLLIGLWYAFQRQVFEWD